MKQQHVAFYRKVLLRKNFLRRFNLPGAVYVPFIGDGDLAVECYENRTLFGADIDAARVQVAKSRLNGRIVVADCDPWPFPGENAAFSIADFDAYVYPYQSFRSFWSQANKNDLLVMFFTDTVKQDIKRNGRMQLPDGTIKTGMPEVVEGSRERSWHYNFWFSKHVRPWFDSYIEDEWVVLDRMRYLRQDTVYWGVAIQRKPSLNG